MATTSKGRYVSPISPEEKLLAASQMDADYTARRVSTIMVESLAVSLASGVLFLAVSTFFRWDLGTTLYRTMWLMGVEAALLIIVRLFWQRGALLLVVWELVRYIDRLHDEIASLEDEVEDLEQAMGSVANDRDLARVQLAAARRSDETKFAQAADTDGQIVRDATTLMRLYFQNKSWTGRDALIEQGVMDYERWTLAFRFLRDMGVVSVNGKVTKVSSAIQTMADFQQRLSGFTAQMDSAGY